MKTTKVCINLDLFTRLVAGKLAKLGDGLWIEAPKEGHHLWLVARMSDVYGSVVDSKRIHYHRKLADALGILMFKLEGTHHDTDSVEASGTNVYRAAVMLARLGDSLYISNDEGMWLFEAENSRIHVTSEKFDEALAVFDQAIEKHLHTTIYSDDNNPLD